MVGALASPAAALDVPPLTGRIVDNAHLLPADRTASLSAELAAHEARTGNQVVLLTLPSLEGEPLEEFSHRVATRSEEHTSELQSRLHLVCRLLLEKKKNKVKSSDQ